MPTEFYLEIQNFNSDWEITITLLHSRRKTQRWQVHDVTATVGKTPPYRAVQNLKKNLPTRKSLSMCTLTMRYWILVNFKNIFSFI